MLALRASAFYGAALLLPLDNRIGGKQHIELSLKFIKCVKCENFPRVFEIKKVSRTPPRPLALYISFFVSWRQKTPGRSPGEAIMGQ